MCSLMEEESNDTQRRSENDPEEMVPELSGREGVRRRSRKKNRAGTGYYSGDALLRQPFWILRD